MKILSPEENRKRKLVEKLLKLPMCDLLSAKRDPKPGAMMKYLTAEELEIVKTLTAEDLNRLRFEKWMIESGQ